jgi:hypothetical protein
VKDPKVLYRPIDKNFPGVDYLFLDNSREDSKPIISGLQLTISSSHQKKADVYFKLFNDISLPDDEKMRIFVVCPERLAEGYAKNFHSKMIENFRPSQSPASLIDGDEDWNLGALISAYRKSKARRKATDGDDSSLASSTDEKNNILASTILLHKIEFNVLKFELVSEDKFNIHIHNNSSVDLEADDDDDDDDDDDFDSPPTP